MPQGLVSTMTRDLVDRASPTGAAAGTGTSPRQSRLRGLAGVLSGAQPRAPGLNRQLADMTLAGWRDIQDRIMPLENTVIAHAMGDGEAAADRAGDLARRGGALAQETFQRNLDRSGTALDPATKAALARRRALSTALDAGGAEDSARRDHRETSTAMMSDIVGLGRQIRNSAIGGLDAAANAQSQRRNANAAASQARTQSALGLAGMAASFFI